MPRICFSCPKQLQNISCSLFENPQKFGFLYIYMCVLIILLSFIHHKPYDINPFVFLKSCFKWHGYLSFKKWRKKYKQLKTYLFVKLFKQNEAKDKKIENSIIKKKSDKIIFKNSYLQMILFLKYAWILHSIVTLNQSSTKSNKDLWMFKRHYTCKFSFDHCYKLAYIIWINEIK